MLTQSGSKSTIVNTLLTEMSGFVSRPGVYLMATTNLLDKLDPAVLRPGRFDTKLYVGLPDAAGRLAVLNAATKVTNATQMFLTVAFVHLVLSLRSSCVYHRRLTLIKLLH